jgi:hypothetical protein
MNILADLDYDEEPRYQAITIPLELLIGTFLYLTPKEINRLR